MQRCRVRYCDCRGPQPAGSGARIGSDSIGIRFQPEAACPPLHVSFSSRVPIEESQFDMAAGYHIASVVSG